MTVIELVIAFIFMALALMTILVVGTLGAADMLHRPRRRHKAEEDSDSNRADQPQAQYQAEAKGRRDSPSDAASERNAGVVEALMPLGTSLSFVWHPKGHTTEDPGTDPEDPPPHGRAA
jgi:hypothetical protein